MYFYVYEGVSYGSIHFCYVVFKNDHWISSSCFSDLLNLLLIQLHGGRGKFTREHILIIYILFLIMKYVFFIYITLR